MVNDLPANARKYEEREVRKILDTLRKKDIDFYEKTQHCINGGVEYLRSFGAIASHSGWAHFGSEEDKKFNREFFNGELSPTVEGVWYYRGIAIPRRNGTILLYTPHMQPWRPEQRKETFQVYTLGDISAPEVIEVIKAYSERMSKHIDRVLARKVNEERFDLLPHLFSD